MLSASLSHSPPPATWHPFPNVLHCVTDFVVSGRCRANYCPAHQLGTKNFTIAGRNYSRLDIELRNQRGHTLQCSHCVPSPFPEDTSLPCVVFCHGNRGSRVEAKLAAFFLLPLNITVFTLDFSGSGLSDGDYVSLGCHEKDDLKVVVSYLRSRPQTSRIGLWGWSMGAVTCLLYGAEDPSIAGMVLDSPFANLSDLLMERVDKSRIPKFLAKVAIRYMRRVIKKKAKFDIMDLNCQQLAPKMFIPALFGHAGGDKLIQSHHSDLIFNAYAGDKQIIKFDGDHRSCRPRSYLDSVCIFFYNVLQPPRNSPVDSSKQEKYFGLRGIKVRTSMAEHSLHSLCTGCFMQRQLYEIISGLQVMEPHGTSSLSAARDMETESTPVSMALSVVAPVTTDLMADESNLLNDMINREGSICRFTE